MSSLSLKKAFKDLLINKRRTALVLLAMIIGSFGVSALLNSTAILIREMDKNYMNTNPASAVLSVNNMSADMLNVIKALPEIKNAELRKTVVAQVDTGSGPAKEMYLSVVPDFEAIKISTFKPEKGSWPPKTGEVLIERASMSLTGADIGDDLKVKLPSHEAVNLKLAGTVHAPALPPGWMEDIIFGFVTPDTVNMLGGSSAPDELEIVVSKDPLNKEAIRETVYKLKSSIEHHNGSVTRIDIPKPGKHPHASQMQTLLFILQFFSILTFILSTIIVANLLSAIMSQQKRQIGIMKAIGAKSGRIASIYLGFTLILGIISTVIAVPAAVLAGRAYAAFGAGMLNFEIYDGRVPHSIYLFEILFSILFPMLIAAFSVWQSGRITVVSALQSHGVALEDGRAEVKYSFIFRPFLVSLRNTFRKKARLLFTLCVLSLGGALFITAMNIMASMNSSILGVISAFKYDVSINLVRDYNKTELESKITAVPGVKSVELWGGAEASPVHPDGLNGDNFNILAIPAETKMMDPVKPSSGRWLTPEDTNAIVVNQYILSMEPGTRVGDTLKLKIGNGISEWKVVGIVQEIMSVPKAYVNQKYFNTMADGEEQGRNAIVVTDNHDDESINSVTTSINKLLESEGYDVLKLERLTDVEAKIKGHLWLLAAMLLVMSVLGAIVGGMGLSTTMSINVMERTRELGIMRAIGATPKMISKIILGEGMLIGALSCIIAAVVSVPLSIFISDRFGTIFFETPMRATISPLGILIWSAAAVLFAALSSRSPAKRASREKISDVLAYE
ncbi:MAG: FtsX-like permease family protein [Bacillota bacterium]|nr:FtsX-like permease family protein [Bacillota bacterium]